MNHPAGAGLVQFRDYFKKCANVINFREVLKSGYIREGFLSFDTRLEARRACTMNQNFMNGKRLLIHMANESLFLDPELCVMVMGLTALVSDEDIYDRFSDIGNVKFVQRQSASIACVCMEQQRWLESALRVIMISKQQVIVSRVAGINAAGSSSGPSIQQTAKSSYLPTVVIKDVPRPNLRPIELGRMTAQGPRPMGNAAYMAASNGMMMGPGGPMMGPGGPMIGPGGPMMGPGGPLMIPGGSMMGPGGPMMGPGGPMGPNGQMMGPGGPMMGPGGPMMGPAGPMMGPGAPMMGPGGPMMGPGGPMMGPGGQMMGPGGPMMGPGGPMNQNPPIVTPAMRRLMQMIESQMINIQAFSSLPMIEQFRLVHGVVNQFIQVPQFVDMKPDDKIRFLISGQNGFAYANTFTLFTYPQQLQLLALIQQDYWNTINCTPVPTIMQGPAPNPMTQSQPVNVNPAQSTKQAEVIPDPMEGEDIVAPWQIKSSHPPTPTETTPESSLFDTIPLSAQDRFEKAEKLRLEVKHSDTKNKDALSISSDSDSESIPPAPEPPKFSSKKSSTNSPLPSQLSRSRSRSPVYNRRSRSRSISRRRKSRSPDSLSPFSKALLSSPLLRYDRSASKSPERYRQSLTPPRRTDYRTEKSSRDKEKRRSRSRSPHRPRHSSPSRTTRHSYRHRKSRSRSHSRSIERRPARKSRSKSESPLSLSPPRDNLSPKLWDDPSVPKLPSRHHFKFDVNSATLNSRK